MVAVGNYRNRAELRKKARRHFHYGARIFTNAETPTIKCSIVDISDSGARLELKCNEELAESFMLLLTSDGSALRHCRVVWRDGLAVGVKFSKSR